MVDNKNRPYLTTMGGGGGYKIHGRPAAVCDKSLYSNFYSYRTEHENLNNITTTTCVCYNILYIYIPIRIRIKKANGIHCDNPRTSDEVSVNK